MPQPHLRPSNTNTPDFEVHRHRVRSTSELLLPMHPDHAPEQNPACDIGGGQPNVQSDKRPCPIQPRSSCKLLAFHCITGPRTVFGPFIVPPLIPKLIMASSLCRTAVSTANGLAFAHPYPPPHHHQPTALSPDRARKTTTKPSHNCSLLPALNPIGPPLPKTPPATLTPKLSASHLAGTGMARPPLA